MAAEARELKTYRIDVAGNGNGASTYYGRGVDAHAVYSELVKHDEKEGNWARTDGLTLSVDITEIAPNDTFIAWELG